MLDEEYGYLAGFCPWLDCVASWQSLFDTADADASRAVAEAERLLAAARRVA